MGIRTVHHPRRHPSAYWRGLVMLACLVGGLILTPTAAGAQDDDGVDNVRATHGFIDVIEVNGLIDPVLAEFIDDSLDDATASNARAIVLQMESAGSTIDEERLSDLVSRVSTSDVPVSVWLGPAGKGRAMGGAGRIAAASTRLGISPGSKIGDFGAAAAGDPEGPLTAILAGGVGGAEFGYDNLLELRAADAALPIQDAPTILNHLLELPEFDFDLYQPGDVLPNGALVVDEPTRYPLTGTRFVTLPLTQQQFHTFASPAVAYLLFVIGLGLLVFELFTAGVGVAGVIGAGSFIAGSYGLAVLDARAWAVGALVVAFVAFAIDVQSGIQQFWSGLGSILLIVGSIFLLEEHSIGWLALLVGIIGVLLAMLGGMPAMVRTRFSTPTIGREWMIGEVGEVVESVDPEGIITVDGAPWRARTNRATPIEIGDRARVVEVDGLLLEVEPVEGAAVDYRERRKART